MNDLQDIKHQTATAKPSIEPALRAVITPEYTDEQIETASRPPSLEALFTAHLRLLALQDAEQCAADR
jgi:hypothetical protein